MKIKLSQAGKRFNREWIFRKADLDWHSGQAYAVTGPNGSGKSTLLQSLGGMLQLSEGKIEYTGGKARPGQTELPLNGERVYREISFCAPYLDLIEEMTLEELLGFHHHFKPFIEGIDAQAIIGELGLETAARKQIRYYSSGMKQRVKLAQAIFYDTSIILLDEPCSNLDRKGIDLYHHLIEKYCAHRLVVVCSNDPVEYGFCQTVLSITDYKH